MAVLKYRDPATGNALPLIGGSPVPTEPTGFRNVIRNGDMQIAQRGDGPFTTKGYLVDGFSSWYDGGTVTTSRVAQAIGQGSALYRVAISGQGAAADNCQVAPIIEDAATFSGKQVTLSFDAFAASGTPKISLELQQGGSSLVVTNIGTVTISTAKTRYSMTFTVPPLTGTLSGPATYLKPNFWLSAGTNHASRAPIGIQNNTFSITDVQLEAGAVATPFERLPQQQQLAWCQRYFYRLGFKNPHLMTTSWGHFAQGWAYHSTRGDGSMLLPVTMRANPTVTTSGSPAHFIWALGSPSGFSAVLSSITFENIGTNLVHFYTAMPSANVVQGQAMDLTGNQISYPSTAYMDFSAEF